MYVKFQNAAVFVEPQFTRPTPTNSHPPRQLPIQATETKQICLTLWSDRPFALACGRLVGVRKTGNQIEVALVATGTQSVAWMPADKLLSQTQINRWLASSSFR